MRILIFGTFDIIHPGHLNMFRQTKEHGDELFVVVARDKTVEDVKGSLPENDENERLRKIKALPMIDNAFLGMVDDKYALIKKIKPEIICLGYDQETFTDKLKEMFPDTDIVRLKPYKPDVYKSSKLK